MMSHQYSTDPGPLATRFHEGTGGGASLSKVGHIEWFRDYFRPNGDSECPDADVVYQAITSGPVQHLPRLVPRPKPSGIGLIGSGRPNECL
jgi:hypothetical protein